MEHVNGIVTLMKMHQHCRLLKIKRHHLLYKMVLNSPLAFPIVTLYGSHQSLPNSLLTSDLDGKGVGYALVFSHCNVLDSSNDYFVYL